VLNVEHTASVTHDYLNPGRRIPVDVADDVDFRNICPCDRTDTMTHAPRSLIVVLVVSVSSVRMMRPRSVLNTCMDIGCAFLK
jgi:hypothetical protein